jgi:toxin FitB
MTAYLIDTNVISELTKPTPDVRVLKFLAREGDLWLSVVTLHELSYGVMRIAESGRRNRIAAWTESVKARFRGRLIFVDQAIAEAAGRARGHAALEGRAVAPLDALIGATAWTRSMILATRNVRHFEALDISIFDPWSP